MQTFKKPLTPVEENHYLKQCRAGNQTARNILIEYNLRLVAHIAKKYSATCREGDDLLSVGTIGLIKAIDTFDAAKGSKLASYASRCIENELLMMLRQEKKRSREVSIYEPIGTDKEGNEIVLMDIISEGSSSVLDSLVTRHDLTVLPGYVNSCLTPREKQILILRYGLSGENIHTQKEVSDTIG
ncbi:MAG: sigma-70 family RNA polymerase sigma factor, partial [Coprococcus sp.]